MRHRGPDENEVWSDSRAVFGFNRLSIIDIEHSHQPLPYADGRYRIVFNGEIYNYLELRERAGARAGASSPPRATARRSSPATTYWGEDVVARLRGMFAFLIWDTQDRVLFGARDSFGIKPLFTARRPTARLVLQLEKKALLELLGGSEARRRRRRRRRCSTT